MRLHNRVDALNQEIQTVLFVEPIKANSEIYKKHFKNTIIETIDQIYGETLKYAKEQDKAFNSTFRLSLQELANILVKVKKVATT